MNITTMIFQKCWWNNPQYSKDSFSKISSDEHPVVSRNRTTFCIQHLNLYSHKLAPPRSENHFAIKDYWLANFIIIWLLVRRLIILTENQCTWWDFVLIEEILLESVAASTYTHHPSHICQMLLILSLCSLGSSSVTQCVWIILWSSLLINEQVVVLFIFP